MRTSEDFCFCCPTASSVWKPHKVSRKLPQSLQGHPEIRSKMTGWAHKCNWAVRKAQICSKCLWNTMFPASMQLVNLVLLAKQIPHWCWWLNQPHSIYIGRLFHQDLSIDHSSDPSSYRLKSLLRLLYQRNWTYDLSNRNSYYNITYICSVVLDETQSNNTINLHLSKLSRESTLLCCNECFLVIYMLIICIVLLINRTKNM